MLRVNWRPISHDSLQVIRRERARLPSQRAISLSSLRQPDLALDEWSRTDIRPVSLRQLTFFGRSLTPERLFQSANYVRTELPTRLAHRLRDMQRLPHVVATNEHIAYVYDLYLKSFDALRNVGEIRSIEQNQSYCELVTKSLTEHASVIPKLAMGILEGQDYLLDRSSKDLDKFMDTMLRSRISRRVIAEQHLALTTSYADGATANDRRKDPDFVGEIFLKCNAGEVIERCGAIAAAIVAEEHGSGIDMPPVHIEGDTQATFAYIPSHLEYTFGELLRNAMQAVVQRSKLLDVPVTPVEVMVCEAPQNVIFRFSDQGGGIPRSVMPNLWSFTQGPDRRGRIEALRQVDRMNATVEDLAAIAPIDAPPESSVSVSGTRQPDLRLGIGLPMCRVYAEYWAGCLDLENLDGYGVDVSLHIPKLGNRNEQLITRASLDIL